MYNQGENIVNFYKEANDNKYIIAKKRIPRDLSVAEMTILSCIDAIARHSYSQSYDINKVIRMIFLNSLNGKMNSLSNEKEYELLIEDLKNGLSTESGFANISISKIFSDNENENYIITDLLNNYMKLQTTIRQGHIYWGASGERLESILEHIYGCMVIALGIESEYNYSIDFNKILKMLLLHETEEIKIGDLTEWDISKERKEELGKKAVKDVLCGLNNGEEYIKLIDEFNTRETLESKYSNLCDKLEYDMQVKMYELNGRYDFNNRPDNVVTRSSSVRQIINNGASSVFDVHYEYDKHRYSSIPCMRGILELTKKL